MPSFITNQQISINNIDFTNILPFVFNKWRTTKDTFFKRSLDYGFNIQQNQTFGDSIDAGWVSRAILSILATQIKDFCSDGYPKTCAIHKLFVERTEDSERYILNQDFRFTTPKTLFNTDSELGKSSERLQKEYDVINNSLPYGERLLYELAEFIGAYYSFCLISNINIGFQLSRNLLYGMYTNVKDMDNTKVLTYFFIDNANGGLARTALKFYMGNMRFEELPISDKSKTTSQLARFNDYARKFHPEIVKFKLVKKNKSVTNENLINYLLLAALYENFGISIEGDKLFYFNLVKAFYRGIDTHTLTSMLGTLNKLLQDESKATLILDSLLSTYVMPTEPSSDEKTRYTI